MDICSTCPHIVDLQHVHLEKSWRVIPLVPLTLILKQFLVAKGLNDPYTGGLSSYGTLLMVAAVLDESEHMRSLLLLLRDRKRLRIPYEGMNLGALLIVFLRLYVNSLCSSDNTILKRYTHTHTDTPNDSILRNMVSLRRAMSTNVPRSS